MPTSSKTSRPNTGDPIRQFTLSVENKVGALQDLTVFLGGQSIHVLALSVVDCTESAIVRLVLDDPDHAVAVFRQHGYTVAQSDVLGVEFATEADLQPMLAALLEAEVNIHYLYPFLVRPGGKPALVLRVEDNELGAHALSIRNYRVLGQRDLSR